MDLVFASHNAFHTPLRGRHLYYESYVLIGRHNHPVLSANLPLEEFVRLEHVIVSPSGGRFTTPIDNALKKFRHKCNVVMLEDSFLFITEIVQKSHLVALIPKRLLQAHAGPLTVIELPWLAEQFDICLIWHERSNSHAEHRWIRELIIEMNG